jgi:putative transposase
MEHDLQILSGKVSRDHIHVFISYHPHQQISKIVQWLKGTSSRVLLQEFPHLQRQPWGRHVWARGYLAVSSGTITDEMVEQYIAEQEGEPIQDESQFVIDEDTKLPPSRRYSFTTLSLTYAYYFQTPLKIVKTCPLG